MQARKIVKFENGCKVESAWETVTPEKLTEMVNQHEKQYPLTTGNLTLKGKNLDGQIEYHFIPPELLRYAVLTVETREEAESGKENGG